MLRTPHKQNAAGEDILIGVGKAALCAVQRAAKGEGIGIRSGEKPGVFVLAAAAGVCAYGDILPHARLNLQPDMRNGIQKKHLLTV